MKSLEDIKNDYATNLGYMSWRFMLAHLVQSKQSSLLNLHINNVMILAQKQALKNASESVTTVHHKECKKEDVIKAIHYTKHSITNENNIIK